MTTKKIIKHIGQNIPDLFLDYSVNELQKIISIDLPTGHLDSSLLIRFILQHIEIADNWDRYKIELKLLDTIFDAKVVKMGSWLQPKNFEGPDEYTLSIRPKINT